MQHSAWKCPRCGRLDISGDLVKCPACGKKRNRWGYWDCASCQTKGIRGDHHECPNCGRPRARNVKFYLRDDLVEYVDEVSGQEAVRIGRANWICPYCNQQNDDATDTCTYCGAARTESRERYHDVAPEGTDTTPQPAVRKKKTSTDKACCLAALVPFVLMIIVLMISAAAKAVSAKKLRHADLTAAYWESTVQLEEMHVREASDWELPPEARLLYTNEEDYRYVDHYERRSREVWVDDDDDDDDWDWDDDDDGGGWDDGGWDDGGWDDYGDGQFGMFLLAGQAPPQIIPLHYETEYYDEPIYATEKRTKYYYEYDSWEPGRRITERGEPGTEPHYGTFTLAENEREGGRSTEYYIEFMYKSELVKLACTRSECEFFMQRGTVDFRCDSSGQTKQFTLESGADN